MVYPPANIPPSDRIDSTPLTTNHIEDHNEISVALSSIVTELGTAPSAGSVDVETRLDRMSPVGLISDYGGSSAPPDWLLCDGSAYDGGLPQFAELWAVIGNTWGGTTQADFKVPDLRSRMTVGFDDRGGIGTTLGATGGQTDVKQHSHANTANQTQHRHTVDPPNTSTNTTGAHSHNIGSGTQLYWVQAGQNEGFLASGSAGRSGAYATTGANGGDHAHTVNIAQFNSGYTDPAITMTNANAGAGTDNMNPYGVVNKIIYAGTIQA